MEMFILIKFLNLLLLIASIQAATLTCTFDPTTQACLIFTLSPVTQENEDILVPGAPFTPYVDITTQTIVIDQNTDIQFFPRKIFNIFTNLVEFYGQYMKNTELGTDSFHNCNMLQNIYFDFYSFTHISAGFASTCSSVSSIFLVDGSLTSIDENAFVGLKNLVNLYIFKNQLKCIPPKVLQPLKNLQTFHLRHTQIDIIHSQLFMGLTKLTTISLTNNKISYVPNFNLMTTGIDIPGARLTIDFQENFIKVINSEFLTSLYTEKITSSDQLLITFTVATDPLLSCINTNIPNSNEFATIGQSSDWNLQNQGFQLLTTCYSCGKCTTRAMDLLALCPSLITTTSSSTTVSTKIGDQVGGQCATDKICRYYLDWNNQYTCVIDGAEGTVTSITGTHYLTYTNADVKRVYFINSYLSLVPKILFQTFPNLKFLHTANSGMTVINDQTFNECGQLELWDASDNDISHVDETSLRNCTSLRIIDLTGNPIDYVSQGLYQLDPALERVHLNRLNDWTMA